MTLVTVISLETSNTSNKAFAMNIMTQAVWPATGAATVLGASLKPYIPSRHGKKAGKIPNFLRFVMLKI